MGDAAQESAIRALTRHLTDQWVLNTKKPGNNPLEDYRPASDTT